MRVPSSSQRQTRTLAPGAVCPWPGDVISQWLRFLICDVRNQATKPDDAWLEHARDASEQSKQNSAGHVGRPPCVHYY